MTTTKAIKEPVVAAEPTEPKPLKGWRRPIIGEAVDAALHTYEQFVASFVEFEHKAAENARSDRAKAALNLHATFVEDLTAVYMRTVRAAMR
jgi:hypothetical protein